MLNLSLIWRVGAPPGCFLFPSDTALLLSEYFLNFLHKILRLISQVASTQLCHQPFSKDPWFLTVVSPKLLLLTNCSFSLAPQKWLE